jgi:hypothetical protein
LIHPTVDTGGNFGNFPEKFQIFSKGPKTSARMVEVNNFFCHFLNTKAKAPREVGHYKNYEKSDNHCTLLYIL